MLFDLEEAIPHKPPMRWLDRVINVDQHQAICEAKITKEHIFYRSDINGIDSWLSIEMMAQAAAVFVHGQEPKAIPRIAFLMSVRYFQAHIPFFAIDDLLTVSVHCTLLDNNMGVFLGKVELHKQVVASAQLSAYKPSADELKQVLAG